MTATPLAPTLVYTVPRSSSIRPGRILLYVILSLALVYYAIPLLLVISTSLKTAEELRNGNIFTLPQSLNFDA